MSYLNNTNNFDLSAHKHAGTLSAPIEIIMAAKSPRPTSGDVLTGGKKPVMRSFRFVVVKQINLPGGADQNSFYNSGESATSGFNHVFHDSCIGPSLENGRNRGPFKMDPDTGAISSNSFFNKFSCSHLYQASNEENLSEGDVQTLQVDLSDLAPSFTVSDTPGGNTDGAVDPAEKLRATVALSDRDFAPAGNATVKHHDARHFYPESWSLLNLKAYVRASRWLASMILRRNRKK